MEGIRRECELLTKVTPGVSFHLIRSPEFVLVDRIYVSIAASVSGLTASVKAVLTEDHKENSRNTNIYHHPHDALKSVDIGCTTRLEVIHDATIAQPRMSRILPVRYRGQ
jgi:hypothetical protein